MYEKIREGNQFATFWLYVIIIAMSVSLSFLEGDGRFNWALLGIMFVSPLVIISYPDMDRINVLLLLFMVTIIFASLLNHPEMVRWTTILYSIVFVSTFWAYNLLLTHTGFTITKYELLIKVLIYAYTVVLIVQQVCVLLGLPIFNVMSGYDPENPWKLNSLAAEPSWAARTVGLFMFSYLTVKEVIGGERYNIKNIIRDDKWVWLAFLWTMVTMRSGTAFIFLALVIVKIVRAKNIAVVVVMAALIVTVADFMGVKEIVRARDTVVAVLTLDERQIIKTDASASTRIVPSIVGIKHVGVTTLDDWFGHGVDYSLDLVYRYLRIPVAKDIPGAGAFTIWLNYGLLAFLIFHIFSLSVCVRSRDLIPTLIIWFMAVFINGINIQIPWMAMIFLYANKYFAKQHDGANQ